ncbi:MAG: class I SAM-dependent methyltransferase, partial [Anaerovorax sp.]
PIFLLAHKISPKVILSDIGEGPLEKAKENIDKYWHGLCFTEEMFSLRQGNGLETLQDGEVEDVVIAGMGGKLMIKILEGNMEKSRSYQKFIFQPRNAPEKLEAWLMSNGFIITDAVLAREGIYIWEIFTAKSLETEKLLPLDLDHLKNGVCSWLIKKQDPLFREFINRKIAIEQRIVQAIVTKSLKGDCRKLEESRERIMHMKGLLREFERVALG